MDWNKIGETIVSNGVVAGLVATGGILIWQWQQRHKRRMEVAERAMMAFEQAEAGLAIIRSVSSSDAEESQVVVPEGITGDDEKRYRKYGIYFARLRDQQAAFADIAPCLSLCRMHLGQEAADAMHELLKVRHDVWVAAFMLRQRQNDGPTDQSAKELYQQLQYDLWQTQQNPDQPSKYDKLTPRVIEAKAKLEAACRKYFTDPLTWRKIGRRANPKRVKNPKE